MTRSVIIGLTGPTGAGKSTVGGILGELGCAVIDCDKTARQVLVDCEPCVRELRQEFGDDIVAENGRVDRALLARRAFSSHEKTKRLNAITHPWILGRVQDEIDEWKNTGKEFIVVDAPLLFESGAEKLCDKILAVITPMPVRLERIILRDHIDREMAVSRIHAQQEDAYYTERADACLRGDENPEELRRQAAALLERWRR
ncbi:dephospho-CoA kinase [Faecalispora anaeroviscerum]|uniref:dephospho-CoA kinase n=1 Tax=Faecalispora anaeroviscerum TaxID=2991836 RepID=UPI0024BA7381|nr:dephospho-CoA kinase [Faecalispora anaeroviscerum]